MALKYTVFPEKTILKWNKELVELHKRVITTYLASKGIGYSTRQKFFRLYDLSITEYNIKLYFYTPTPMLIQYVVKGQVDQISTYTVNHSKRKRHDKRKSRTNKR